jgi:hypothetical protein
MVSPAPQRSAFASMFQDWLLESVERGLRGLALLSRGSCLFSSILSTAPCRRSFLFGVLGVALRGTRCCCEFSLVGTQSLNALPRIFQQAPLLSSAVFAGALCLLRRATPRNTV